MINPPKTENPWKMINMSNVDTLHCNSFLLVFSKHCRFFFAFFAVLEFISHVSQCNHLIHRLSATWMTVWYLLTKDSSNGLNLLNWTSGNKFERLTGRAAGSSSSSHIFNRAWLSISCSCSLACLKSSYKSSFFSTAWLFFEFPMIFHEKASTQCVHRLYFICLRTQ